MKKYHSIVLILLFTCTSKSHSQFIFPEAYPGCNTDKFTLERDTMTAKIDDSELLQVLTLGFSDKIKNKIEGTLTLQIIVDYEGNSCLVSLKNETNVRTRRLKLKETIDNNLKWSRPVRKISAVVLVVFEDDDIKVVRLGMDTEKGVHVLKS